MVLQENEGLLAQHQQDFERTSQEYRRLWERRHAEPWDC